MKIKTIKVKSIVKQYFVYPLNFKKRVKTNKNKDSWVDFVIPTRKKEANISESIDKQIIRLVKSKNF